MGTAPVRPEATAALAAFACAKTPAPVGDGRHVARALLDTVGGAMAASDAPPDRLLRAWIAKEGGAGNCAVWTSGRDASAVAAALVNGTAAHALDWDDVSPGSAMHPSAVLIPALMAYADGSEVSGRALVAAYGIGAAAFRAVAQALPRLEHYRRGWHTTSTVGRLAAVAALANVSHLDEEATHNAFGLCASMAGGTLANFGTMTKPLHAGLAARDALMAVQLSAEGFTANPEQLEAPGGFFEIFGGGDSARLARLSGQLEAWRAQWSEDWAQKRYPACYATHRAIDAVLHLRTEAAGRIPCQIEVVVEPGGLRPLRMRPPSTGTEAKFHLGYVLAVAYLRGDVRLDDFTDSAVYDAATQELLATVSAHESDSPPQGASRYDAGYTVVSMKFFDGEVRSCRVDHTYGDAQHPLEDEDLERKFADGCSVRGLSQEFARELADAVWALPEAPSTHRLRDLLITEE